MRLIRIGFVTMFAGSIQAIAAAALVCPLGEPAAAAISADVVMRSCLWEKEPGLRVRTGPFELIKNGILIEKTQTNAKGKLHGPYIAWSDAGELQEKGNYVEGLKQGDWVKTDENGVSVIVNYRNGTPVEPRQSATSRPASSPMCNIGISAIDLK